MRYSTLQLTAFAATLSHTVFALPTASVPDDTLTKRGVAPNTQGCSASDSPFWVSYSVDIGVTWANGMGCGDVFNSLNAHTSGVWNWQCVADDNGNTQLWFNLGSGEGAGINAALLSMYPWIEGGFNCPDF